MLYNYSYFHLQSKFLNTDDLVFKLKYLKTKYTLKIKDNNCVWAQIMGTEVYLYAKSSGGGGSGGGGSSEPCPELGPLTISGSQINQVGSSEYDIQDGGSVIVGQDGSYNGSYKPGVAFFSCDPGLPFSQAAQGAVGVETLLPLCLEMYHNKSLSLQKIIEVLTINPAKILKIDKGSLKKGKDADLCILDINKPWIVKAENLKSKSKNTAIENRKLQGQVLKTFVKGELAYENI